MSKVSELVNNKIAANKVVQAAADTRKKFVVMLDDKMQDQLVKLSERTGEGRIALASELLKMALDEATEAAKAATKTPTP